MTKEMWAILHVPSQTWYRGDTQHTFYHAEYRAQRECPNEAFVPVKVYVSDQPPASRGEGQAP